MSSPTPLEVAVLSAFRKAAGEHGLDGKLNESNLKALETTGLAFEVLRPIIDSLTARGLLEFFPSKPHITINLSPTIASGVIGGPGPWTLNTDDAWRLTALGARASFGEQVADEAAGVAIPAADRFVSLDDNRREVQEARAAVNDLAEVLKGSNDLFADPDARLHVLREVGLLQTALSGPKARLATLWQATTESGPVRWLAKEGAGAVVKAAVERAVAAVLALIRSLVGAL